MKKRKIIIPALLTIAACTSVAAGATYALFTSESAINIAVTSGKVDVVATIDSTSVQTKSLNTEYQNGQTNFYEGTAAFDDATQTLKLENLVPGDAIKFNIVVTNNSTVTVKYLTSVMKSLDTGLFKGLNITVNGKTYTGSPVIDGWNTLEASTTDVITVPVEIELPNDASNDYQAKSCTISYKVEAVQGNGETPDRVFGVGTDADLKSEVKATFNSSTDYTTAEAYLGEGEYTIKNIGSKLLSGKTISFIGSGVNSTTYVSRDNGTSQVENGADYSLEGATVTFKDMTVDVTSNNNYNGFVRATSLTFENCVIKGCASYWGETTVFKNCTFESTDGYNIFTYSGNDFTFDGCIFNTTKKFINCYKENEPNLTNITVKNCIFNAKENETGYKPALWMKFYGSANWNIVWENSTVNNVDTANMDSEATVTTPTNVGSNLCFGGYSNIFAVRADGKTLETFDDTCKTTYSSTKVTVDGVVKFENCEIK